MKSLTKLLFPVLIISGLSAQFRAWRLNLNVNPRPSQFVDDWRRTPHIVSLSITYMGTTPVSVRLRATLRHERFGIVLSGYSRTITFRPHETMIINNTSLVDWNTVEYPERLARRVMRTGRLPSGEYQLCVDVMPSENRVEATQCANFRIVAPSPPRLISPADRDTVQLEDLAFRWTPISVPPTVHVRYRFRVWEFMPGDNRRSAMSRNPIIDETLTSTQYLPFRRIGLEHGHSYIWAVQSVDESGNPIGDNNGLSEVRRFVVAPRRFRFVILPDYLVMGRFLIHVTNYTPDAVLSSLSGTGTSFFHDESTNVRVSFQVSFSGLSSDSVSGDTAFISSGEITKSFSTPLEVHAAGFTLHITGVHFYADSVRASLYLTHPCIYDTGSSELWHLGPITTVIDTNGGFYKIVSSSGLQPFRTAGLDIYFQPTGDITVSTVLSGPTGGGHGVHITPPHGGIGPPGNLVPPAFPHLPPNLILMRGVLFSGGRTIPRSEMLNSNIGYLYGTYSFSNATLADSGLFVKLTLSQPLNFQTVTPYDFQFHLDSSYITIAGCEVTGGRLVGYVEPPNGDNGISLTSGARIRVRFDSLSVDSTLETKGNGRIDKTVKWGGYRLKHRGNVHLRFTAEPREFFSLVKGDSMKNLAGIDPDTLVGLVIRAGGHPQDTLFIVSPDVPSGAIRIPCGTLSGWLVLDEQGVTGQFRKQESGVIYDGRIGRKGESGYIAKKNFGSKIFVSPRDSMFFYLQFAGNALFDARMDGRLKRVPEPSHIEFPFKKMSLTSTAWFVGGVVKFDSAQTLTYWGVKITSRSGYVSVRTGEVIFTNADISEPVHFSRPFNVIWGDILADGKVRRFDFNHNSAFQKFDGFPITLDSAGLSKYDTSVSGPLWGALVVRSNIHFKFFGEPDTLVTVFDHRYDTTRAPFKGRYVYIKNPEKFKLYRKWGWDMAVFDLSEITYDTVDQCGFRGSGALNLSYVSGSGVGARVQIDSSFAMICVSSGGQHEVGPPFSSLALLKDLWGCAYIEGDTLKRIVFGGNIAVSTGGSDIFSIKSGMAARMTFSLTPTITQVVVNGKFVFEAVSAVEVEAYAKLTHNRSDNYLEGDIEGMFKLGAGIPLASSNSYARGHFTFHLGVDYTSIQGQGKLYLMETIGLAGVSGGYTGGFFLGVNVPKNRAWVLKHEAGRFGVNMDNLPSTLTGVYGFVDLEYSFDIGLFGGGSEIFIGVGAMSTAPTGASVCETVPLPYVVGDFGIYLHGEILWGLVSASGSLELEVIGGCNFAAQGTMTLRGCAVWVLCAEVDLTVGVSTTRGFYVE